MRAPRRPLLFIVIVVSLVAMKTFDVDWQKVQQLKVKYVSLAAEHAMEMQKTDGAESVSIVFPDKFSSTGSISIRKGDNALAVNVNASPRIFGKDASDKIILPLTTPRDLFSKFTGVAVVVKTGEDTSPEVRAGLTLVSTDGRRTQVQPILPVLSAWDQTTHELYFDWSLLDFKNAEDAIAVLKDVERLEITFASVQRAPKRGPSGEARHATFTLSDLRFVDYHKGSFDPGRRSLKFDQTSSKWVPGDQFDLTIQHRFQEVTGIVASYGKKEGVDAAIHSLDYAVRTQCWDGSFQDGRRGANTVASGEYTFGFTLYGLLQGYRHLEKIKDARLDETIAVGPDRMRRREFYQRMFYRGAMARTIATPSAYRDDIIGGNTLVNGANRVLGYAIAMRMIADVLTDPQQKKTVMEKFGPIMKEIADAQGAFSGGFPVLGEGDKYNGKGIHYDAGYTRTHMDWLVVGARQTGDPLLVQILRKYQTVFEAAMNEEGMGILPMISERHQGNSPVRIILPDATYQIGLKYQLPIIAQWGYNASQAAWGDPEKPRGNFFASGSNARGYTLGAHHSILLDDMDADPVPKDPGYLFPRQFPLWSTRAYSKENQLQRTSVMTFHPDGRQTSDYRIEVGEYPVTVGIPVTIRSSGKVRAVAHELSGWPKLLTQNAKIRVGGDVKAKGRIGKPLKLKLDKETRIVITGPNTVLPAEFGGESLPFKAEFTITPETPGQTVELTVMAGTVPYTFTLEGE
ncbi:MAG: hypothetical protein WA874_21740 [Chryseosolibacter sp.]